jgi:23S rRNA pseudouridine1911/1915/1917 synthase
MHDRPPISALPWRTLEVPPEGAGLRLDTFLARWFHDRSRSALNRAIREHLVTDDHDRVLRASQVVRAGMSLRIRIAGIAPSTAAPPMPDVLYEDDLMVIVDKPAGLLVHPTGTEYAWAVIGLARERWPDDDVDLVHRLDRDTSGCLVLSTGVATNRFLKAAFHDDKVSKTYEAITRVAPQWDEAVLDAPIGPADGPIRIQMAVRDDGLAARTDVRVLERDGLGRARVACVLRTGRTHQIRVHLAHAGASLVGDRMYGVPPEVFLKAWEHGVDDSVIEAAGAPRQALHAARMRVPHPRGGEVSVEAPWPADLDRWWRHPEVLPFDR